MSLLILNKNFNKNLLTQEFIDYDLKGCMEGEFYKVTTTGSSPHFLKSCQPKGQFNAFTCYPAKAS